MRNSRGRAERIILLGDGRTWLDVIGIDVGIGIGEELKIIWLVLYPIRGWEPPIGRSTQRSGMVGIHKMSGHRAALWETMVTDTLPFLLLCALSDSVVSQYFV